MDGSNMRSRTIVGTDTTTPVVQRWMSPLNKIRWNAAIKAKKTSVTLDDGREFTIIYDKRPGEVWVKPADGSFGPCGWLSIERVKRSEWITS